jgi:hypothetical protein
MKRIKGVANVVEVNGVFALQRSRSVARDKCHVALPQPGLIRVIKTQL